MNLYLIRHGAAESKKPNQRDYDRNLTEEGKTEFTIAVNGWKYFIPGFDILVSSPLVRAIQTADIVKSLYNINEDIINDKRLSPGSRTSDIIDIVNEIDKNSIALFGHEPDFSEHVSNLISNNGASVNIKKGTLVKISFNGKARLSAGTLELLLPPLIFRGI